MSSHGGWEFTDDRGHLTVADQPPVRVVAYIDVVLGDVRANAATPDTLRGDRQWRALQERVRTVAWNPEAPRSHRGHARFVDAVAAAL
ncbi:hypothetical protein [Streptomyces niveus]|uniref:hypothetical protein n=1 Tax=Streptomyces niveus TaxID=193462 RepID=UPI0036D329B8